MAYQITEDCTGCGHCVQWCPTKAIKGRRRVSFRITASQCIDCGVCGRICTNSAVICPDGRIAEHLKRSQWNRPHWMIDDCTQCDQCLPACPVKCIGIADMDDAGNGIYAGYPYVSRPRMCIGCGFCSLTCLEAAIQLKPLDVAFQKAAS